jgi:hypothetical protein
VERALVALVVHAQQLETRIDKLEQRIEEVSEAGLDAPTHSDVLEVRMHSAKVAAEMTRLAVSLRAEIDDAVTRVTKPSPEDVRLRTFAEAVLEMSGRFDAPPDAGEDTPAEGDRGAA